MTRPYWNDYQKTIQPTTSRPLWSPGTCWEMEEIFQSKGYDEVMVTCGICSTGKVKNKWVVPRDIIGFFIEELFKRRHIVEVEPHKHNRASIYFVCDEPSSKILEWLHRIPKTKVILMSKSAVIRFKLVQGEWLFEKLLNHLNLTEEEFTTEYGEKLSNDPTCLNNVIVEMMYQNMRRGVIK